MEVDAPLTQPPITDPAALPPKLAARILAMAFLHPPPPSAEADLDLEPDLGDREGPPRWDTDACLTNPLRSVAPLVSRRWRDLLASEAAAAALWRRLHLVDSCVPRAFSGARFSHFWRAGGRAEGMLEVEVDLSAAFGDGDGGRTEALADALAEVLAAAPSLQSLRLGGVLPLGRMFAPQGPLAGRLPSMHRLTSVALSNGGGAGWGVHEGVAALAALPALRRLDVRFKSDVEHPGSGVLDAVCALTALRHLSLQYPLRSALPPVGELPPRMAALTGLTTLRLRRVPLQDPSPPWLAALTNLRHLWWDPYLPADVAGAVPRALGALTDLRTLLLEMRPPLAVPASLTALERLVLAARGGPAPPGAPPQGWAWLGGARALRSLQLQGGSMAALPGELRALSGLTRLALNCNDLGAGADSLPAGPWLGRLEHLHLGSNRIHRFPPALRAAPALRTIHLANQRAGAGAGGAAPAIAANATQRLAVDAADVAAMLGMRGLRTVVMGATQPQVRLGGTQRDFDWLRRVLLSREAGAGGAVRLTSNELAVGMDPLEVFCV